LGKVGAVYQDNRMIVHALVEELGPDGHAAHHPADGASGGRVAVDVRGHPFAILRHDPREGDVEKAGQPAVRAHPRLLVSVDLVVEAK
jgi:hypothetical protein